MIEPLYIGITERGDPSIDLSWYDWVRVNKPAILITKNPLKLYEILTNEFDINKINIIVHSTITGYAHTLYEPNTPSVNESIDGYVNLINTFGHSRIVLRIGPIIPTQSGFRVANNVYDLARYAAGIENKTRVRISFLDNYKHVKNRFTEAGLPELSYNFHAPLKDREWIWKALEKPEICCEPEMENTPCVSDKDCRIFGVEPLEAKGFQRKLCGCLGNKFELLSNKKRCPNKCLYCYWIN